MFTPRQRAATPSTKKVSATTLPIPASPARNACETATLFDPPAPWGTSMTVQRRSLGVGIRRRLRVETARTPGCHRHVRRSRENGVGRYSPTPSSPHPYATPRGVIPTVSSIGGQRLRRRPTGKPPSHSPAGRRAPPVNLPLTSFPHRAPPPAAPHPIGHTSPPGP